MKVPAIGTWTFRIVIMTKVWIPSTRLKAQTLPALVNRLNFVCHDERRLLFSSGEAGSPQWFHIGDVSSIMLAPYAGFPTEQICFILNWIHCLHTPRPYSIRTCGWHGFKLSASSCVPILYNGKFQDLKLNVYICVLGSCRVRWAALYCEHNVNHAIFPFLRYCIMIYRTLMYLKSWNCAILPHGYGSY